MPQQGTSGEPPERRYDETVAPENPPNSVVNSEVRRSATWSYVGGIAAVFVVVAAIFAYFAGTDTRIGPLGHEDSQDATEVGTSGEHQPREGTPGGFDPTPSFSGTKSELEYRGGDAKSVDLDNVTVERAEGDTFWVRDGSKSVAVVTSGGMPTVKAGQKIDLTGTVLSDGRVRASRIDVK